MSFRVEVTFCGTDHGCKMSDTSKIPGWKTLYVALSAHKP